MEQFRNIGIIGRLGSSQVLDTIRRLKKFLLDRHLHVILEDTIAEVLPGHGLQTSTRKLLGEVCDLVIVVGGDGSLLGAARALARHNIPVLGINRGNLASSPTSALTSWKRKLPKCSTATTWWKTASCCRPRCVAITRPLARVMR